MERFRASGPAGGNAAAAKKVYLILHAETTSNDEHGGLSRPHCSVGGVSGCLSQFRYL